jgi:hypothetical protein
VNTWYLKRATDEWLREQRPEAFFRLADPDFTLQPVYDSLKRYISPIEPALDPGYREPLGWATRRAGEWTEVQADRLPFGKAYVGQAGSELRLVFYGTGLAVTTGCTAVPCDGRLTVSIDGGEPRSLAMTGRPEWAERMLPYGRHEATLKVGGGKVALAGLLVRNEGWVRWWWLAPALAGLLVLLWLLNRLRRSLRARRRELPKAAGWRPVARPRVRRQWGRRNQE